MNKVVRGVVEVFLAFCLVLAWPVALMIALGYIRRFCRKNNGNCMVCPANDLCHDPYLE